MLIILTILTPFIFAIISLLLRGYRTAQRSIAVLATLSTLIVSVFLIIEVDKTGIIVLHSGGWVAPFGISLVADRLSAILVLVSSFVAFFVSIYAWKEIGNDLINRHFTPLCLFLLMGVLGAYLTGDLFNLYVWFEVLLVSSFILLVLGSERTQLRGSLKYVVLNLLSSTLFLIGAGLLYGKVGTLNMAHIAHQLNQSNQPELVSSSGMLLLVAFGLKAGVFPLFFWLPGSYATPKSSISALFAGLLTKVGVYAIIRTLTLILEPSLNHFQGVLIFVAITTMIFGVIGAVAQTKISNILSFHIISQVGYILAGVSIMTVSSLAAAIYYLVHHIVVKANLFLIAGIVKYKFGTDHIIKTGGLLKAYPIIGLTFFVSAFSLAGLPPLSGFWAKLGILQASLKNEHWLLSFTVVLVGIFTLISMLKIWLGTFWSSASSETKPNESVIKIPVQMWLPCLFLALCTVSIGLFGNVLFEYSEQAAIDLLNPTKYIESVLGGQK
jgi:multicomponent Na+:H+ antiporter subunit D